MIETITHTNPHDHGDRVYLPEDSAQIALEYWGKIAGAAEESRRAGTDPTVAADAERSRLHARIAQFGPEQQARIANYLPTADSHPLDVGPHGQGVLRARFALARKLADLRAEIDPPKRIAIEQEDTCRHGVSFTAICTACDEDA
jgi:hypothetical protein